MLQRILKYITNRKRDGWVDLTGEFADMKSMNKNDKKLVFFNQ